MTSETRGKGRLAAKQQSGISVTPSDTSEMLEAFSLLSRILSSCYGPRGLCKAIHNNSGGHVMVTSQCARLLQCVHFSRPVLRLWASALRGHVDQFMDQSLFAARLSVELIQGAAKLNCHRHLVVEMFSILSSVCLNYLDSDKCEVKFKFSDVPSEKILQLTSLMKSVIGTKSMCGLNEDDLNHICKLSLETYLSTSVAMASSNRIHYVQVEGYGPADSCLRDGVLYQTPHIPVYAARSVHDLPRVARGSHHGRIRTLLLCISLAGDSEQLPEVTLEMTQRFSIEDAVVSKLMAFGDQLLQEEVGVLLCQKVVHPALRQLLEARGLLVLDRLGAAPAQLLHNLTGGEAVMSAVTGGSLTDSCGYLDDVRPCVYAGKSYVQMTSRHNTVVTVLVANRCEQSLAELKAVLEAGQRVLHVSEQQPHYLAGGGCWQARLAKHVHDQAVEKLCEWAEHLEAPVHLLQPIVSCFTSSLLRAGIPLADQGDYDVIDTSHFHHWTLPTCVRADNLSCSCGLIQHRDGLQFREIPNFSDQFEKYTSGESLGVEARTDCSVSDCFAAARGAVQAGVSIATMLVAIATTVQDAN